MKVLGYGRHSTSGQSLTETAQRTAVDAYAVAYLQRPAADEWLYDTAVSGGKSMFERPEGRRLWVIAQPGDHIVVAKLDRAFRNTRDGLNILEMLEAKGVFFHCVNQKVDTYTAQGRAVLTVLLAFSQMEREQAAERTKEALAVKRDLGLPFGPNAPVGWKKVGKKKESRFVPDQEERDQVKLLKAMRESGMSFDDIVEHMRGSRRTNGLEWNKHSVRRALMAETRRFPKLIPGAQPTPSVSP